MIAKFSTVDAYIAAQPAPVQEGLKQLRQTIKTLVPDAEEGISYGMPGYKYKGSLLWFAAFKTHYGLYPHAKAIEVFREKLSPYAISKGAIRFPLDQPLPLELVAEIVQFRLEENKRKATLKSNPVKP